MPIQQAPIRGAQTIAASVYSHSGEFAPHYTDLRLPGRGLELHLTRFYRSSRADHLGELGRGWSCGLMKKLEREGDDLMYHNGAGEVRRFLRARNGEYSSPAGFYGVLQQEKDHFVIRQRFGHTSRFHPLEAGGGISSIEDRNHNVIQSSYSPTNIAIIDTMSRRVVISVSAGLVEGVADHVGRSWRYVYDTDHRLVEVIQPATADFPQGTSLKYAYDQNHRLISLTDAKGQTYLMNRYDRPGRVVIQKHGSGTYAMEYDPVGTGSDGFPIHRTTCRRKDGSIVVLEHNEAGNVIASTLRVRRGSFAPEDIAGMTGPDVPVVTTSVYNRNSELTSRRFPAGHETTWAYTEHESNPLNQGNLAQITELPQPGVESDQASIVTKYEYESSFQLRAACIDPRGNTTSHQYDEHGNLTTTKYPPVSIQPVDGGAARVVPVDRTQQCTYAYNSMGQLLRRTDIDGSVTEYHYYPSDDPGGTRGPSSATAAPDRVCGYLARLVRDAAGAKIRNEYAYDQFGNTAAVFDGKSNAARLRYNAMGAVESLTGREPFKHRIDYKYDANYNEIESTHSFDRPVYDDATPQTTLRSGTLRETKDYNALDNVTARRIIGDDKIVTESFIRDVNERIARQIQPLGNVTEYVFDERGLVIERIAAVGTKETCTERFAYTLNGAVRIHTDTNGNRTTHHYDGFQRYRGFTDPAGTTKNQWFDEANNVVRVRVDGDTGSAPHDPQDARRERAPLMEAHYHFDQWNRAYRTDQAWHDPATGTALGDSQWNGEKGIVSTVVEYAENGRPGKVWSETGNVAAFEYDGAGRLTAIMDLTGEGCSLEYDENGNANLLRRRGPELEGHPSEQVLRRSHDAMDRLEWQQENDDAPERFRYNALGTVISYTGKSGLEVRHTLDSLGRRAGHAFTVVDPANRTQSQQIVRRYEYDDNYRLCAYVDAMGNRTIYGYDALGRRIAVVYPDGGVARVDHDAKGNVVRVVDQNCTEITNRYDASSRLAERRSRDPKTEITTVAHYQYDGLGRLVAATVPAGVIARTYDSLSRVMAERQGDRLLQRMHDSAGNLVRLVYPGGDEVHKTYDLRKRLTTVKNKTGEALGAFVYRANDQIARMRLGSAIEVDFSYNQQQRLGSLRYSRADNRSLVDGFGYQYDDTGRMIHEIQFAGGPAYGERYYYDDADRPTRAQYGVQNVFDPDSSFEQETSYQHFPEGSWRHRIDVDAHAKVIDDRFSRLNRLNNYETFGGMSFVYDANGNCIRRGTANPGFCHYTYDHDNRLIRSECYDAEGARTQTIEYFYDALSRQVRKVVTDKDGIVTDYIYVWAGMLLIEEYENGVLARTYIYGVGSTPVHFTLHLGGRTELAYVVNGRGLASGLLHKNDPYRFAEKYRYEISGASGMAEIDGVKVSIPLANQTNFGRANSILSGGYLRDWQNRTDSRSGGHINRGTGALLNAVGEEYHYGSGGNGRSDIGRQLNAILGLGAFGLDTTGSGSQSITYPQHNDNLTTSPAHNLFLVGEGESDAPVNDEPLSDPPLVTAEGNAAGGSSVSLTPNSSESSEWKNPYIAPSGATTPSPASSTPAPANSGGIWDHPVVKFVIAGAIAGAKAVEAYSNLPVSIGGTAGGGEGTGTPPYMGPALQFKLPPWRYPNPDADSGNGPIGPLTPQQVEAKSLQVSHPVNPNDDFGAPHIDSVNFKVPLYNRGIDPRYALYDGPQGTRGGVSSGEDIGFNLRFIGGGVTDPVRPGLAPEAPEPPTPGGGRGTFRR
ncbi:MAG TPA: DUF6531 domain-containing protein [Candidatus Acidoferrum sp.]|nr:DUF6531 domain-containing protein [Candidatus Acidoferrum sp.]